MVVCIHCCNSNVEHVRYSIQRSIAKVLSANIGNHTDNKIEPVVVCVQYLVRLAILSNNEILSQPSKRTPINTQYLDSIHCAQYCTSATRTKQNAMGTGDIRTHTNERSCGQRTNISSGHVNLDMCTWPSISKLPLHCDGSVYISSGRTWLQCDNAAKTTATTPTISSLNCIHHT